MGRPPKRARLWLDGKRNPPEWYILDLVDGERVKERTHCGEGQGREAEGVLARYVQDRDAKADEAAAVAAGRRVTQGKREPADYPIAELAAWALERKAPKMARPGEYAARWEVILDYAGEDHLDVVDEDWCTDFASHVGSASYARRCLEDLRAAGRARVKNRRLTYMPHVELPEKAVPRPDYLTWEEVRALVATARWEMDSQERLTGKRPKVAGDAPQVLREVGTSRRRWRHLVPYIVVSVLTCTRAGRVYEASYVHEDGRPWIDLDGGMYHRLADGEVEKRNKKAPEVPLPDALVRWLRWRTRDRTRRGVVIPGDKYLVQYAGRPVDCRKAFEACVERARERFPDLFRRSTGKPKHIVRHTLRHTGVTLLSQWGVPAGDICDYAGMSPEVYDRIYKHVDPDKMGRVMDALGGRAKAGKARKEHLQC